MNSQSSSAHEAHAVKCELAGEVLRASGVLRLRVQGWSMLPTIWPGDTLEIQAADDCDIFEGDIVLWGRGRRIFVHRVVAMSGTAGNRSIVTRGDAMPQPDPLLSDGEVLGKVRFILRDGKRIEPARTLRLRERAVAGLVQRSEMAARVVVRVHGMRRASPVQLQVQTS